MMIDYRLGGWVQNGQNIDYVILEQPLRLLVVGLVLLTVIRTTFGDGGNEPKKINGD